MALFTDEDILESIAKIPALETPFGLPRLEFPSATKPVTAAAPTEKLSPEEQELVERAVFNKPEPVELAKQTVGALGQIKAGFLGGLYSEAQALDYVTGLVSKITGAEKPKVFERLMEKVAPAPEALEEKGVGATVLRAIGQAPIVIAEFLAGAKGLGFILGKAGVPAAVKLGARMGAKEAAETAAKVAPVMRLWGMEVPKSIARGKRFLATPQAVELARKAGTKGVVGIAPPLTFAGLEALHGAAAAEEGEKTLSALLGIPRGLAMGTGLELLAPFSLPTRIAGTAGLFGAAALPEGKEAAISSAIVGAMLPSAFEIPKLVAKRPKSVDEIKTVKVTDEFGRKINVSDKLVEGYKSILSQRGFDSEAMKNWSYENLVYLVNHPEIKPSNVKVDLTTGQPIISEGPVETAKPSTVSEKAEIQAKEAERVEQATKAPPLEVVNIKSLATSMEKRLRPRAPAKRLLGEKGRELFEKTADDLQIPPEQRFEVLNYLKNVKKWNIRFPVKEMARPKAPEQMEQEIKETIKTVLTQEKPVETMDPGAKIKFLVEQLGWEEGEARSLAPEEMDIFIKRRLSWAEPEKITPPVPPAEERVPEVKPEIPPRKARKGKVVEKVEKPKKVPTAHDVLVDDAIKLWGEKRRIDLSELSDEDLKRIIEHEIGPETASIKDGKLFVVPKEKRAKTVKPKEAPPEATAKPLTVDELAKRRGWKRLEEKYQTDPDNIRYISADKKSLLEIDVATNAWTVRETVGKRKGAVIIKGSYIENLPLPSGDILPGEIEPAVAKKLGAKDILSAFENYAKSKGYSEKVVGDYAYRNKKNEIIRLISGKEGITVWEEGVGRYKIPEEIEPAIIERPSIDASALMEEAKELSALLKTLKSDKVRRFVTNRLSTIREQLSTVTEEIKKPVVVSEKAATYQTEEAIAIGKTLTLERAQSLWKKAKTEKDPFRKQFLKEQVKSFLGDVALADKAAEEKLKVEKLPPVEKQLTRAEKADLVFERAFGVKPAVSEGTRLVREATGSETDWDLLPNETIIRAQNMILATIKRDFGNSGLRFVQGKLEELGQIKSKPLENLAQAVNELLTHKEIIKGKALGPLLGVRGGGEFVPKEEKPVTILRKAGPKETNLINMAEKEGILRPGEWDQIKADPKFKDILWRDLWDWKEYKKPEVEKGKYEDTREIRARESAVAADEQKALILDKLERWRAGERDALIAEEARLLAEEKQLRATFRKKLALPESVKVKLESLGWPIESIARIKDPEVAAKILRNQTTPNSHLIDKEGNLVSRMAIGTAEEIKLLKEAGYGDDVLKAMGYTAELEATEPATIDMMMEFATAKKPKLTDILPPNADELVQKALSKVKGNQEYMLTLGKIANELGQKINAAMSRLAELGRAWDKGKDPNIKAEMDRINTEVKEDLVPALLAYRQAMAAFEKQTFQAKGDIGVPRFEKSYSESGRMGTIISMAHENGTIFYTVQGPQGGVADVATTGHNITGTAWVGKATHKGEKVLQIKGWSFGEKPDPVHEDIMLNTILERNLLGDKAIPVIKKRGVAADVWARRRDTHADAMMEARIKRAQFLKEQREEMGQKLQEAYLTAKAAGEPGETLEEHLRILTKEAAKYKEKGIEGPGAMTKEEAAKFIRESVELSDSVEADLFDLDRFSPVGGPKASDYANVDDLFGTPLKSKDPHYRRLGTYGHMNELFIRHTTLHYLKLLDQGLGWLRNNPEKSREFMQHLQKIKESNDPDILAAEKWHRMIMEDIADRFDLIRKGIYVPEYATIQYDMNKIWDFFRKPLLAAKDYDELPDNIIAKIDPKHFWQLKEIANRYSSWDKMDRISRDIVQKEYLQWGAGWEAWDYLPADLREIIPKEKFVRYFQHRTADDRLKFALSEDYWDVTKSYIMTVIRQGIVNEFFLPKARNILKYMPHKNRPGTYGWLAEKYTKRVAGFYGDSYVDGVWNSFAKKINQYLGKNWIPLFVPKEFGKQYAEFLYRGALGPDTALRNITQSIYTWADVGGKNFIKGAFKFLEGWWQKSPEYLRFRDHLNLVQEFFGREIDQYRKSNPSLYEKLSRLSRKLTDLALSPLTFTEHLNKGIAYFAGLEDAAARGLDFRTAHLVGLQKASKVIPNFEYTDAQFHAWNKMAGSQFLYGPSSSSPLLQGTLVKSSIPFLSFPIKSFQLIRDGIRESYLSGDHARLVRFLLLTGFLVGAPAVLASVGLDVKAIWGKGAIPVTIVPMWYNMIRDSWLGSGLNDSDSFMTRELARKRVAESVKIMTIPWYRWLKKTGIPYEIGITEDRGALQHYEDAYTRWGRTESPLTHTNMFKEIMNVLGFPMIDRREARELIREQKDTTAEYNLMKHKIINKILDAQEEGKPQKVQNILNLARSQGVMIDSNDISLALKKRMTDTFTLEAKRAPKAIRAETIQKMEEARQKFLSTQYGTKSLWSSWGEEEE